VNIDVSRLSSINNNKLLGSLEHARETMRSMFQDHKRGDPTSLISPIFYSFIGDVAVGMSMGIHGYR